ncbi:M23 family metallopeptidase [Metabacillus fastidiosus]|uniref:M23 family metallopeptidase n=1 Tax=Metabacillus fastidiosus TaxID=1458 RepID=UPI002E21F940|nr:M23 family metallopeptidase [Metabacillus fastidiosus]
MSHRADEFRRRMARRKKNRQSEEEQVSRQTSLYVSDEEKYGSYSFPSYEANPIEEKNNKPNHPLFRADLFIFKILFSACLILLTAIAFKGNSPVFQEVRSSVTYALEEEFQFAIVAKWYREQFGNPTALFNQTDQKAEKSEKVTNELAVPASGRITESFKDNGQGIIVETNSPVVKPMNEGMVYEVAEKPNTGLTIMIKHADGTKSWYGDLDEVNVSLYDYVEKDQALGKIKINENKKGLYYFAIEQGNNFIDPIQVISFD